MKSHFLGQIREQRMIFHFDKGGHAVYSSMLITKRKIEIYTFFDVVET